MRILRVGPAKSSEETTNESNEFWHWTSIGHCAASTSLLGLHVEASQAETRRLAHWIT